MFTNPQCILGLVIRCQYSAPAHLGSSSGKSNGERHFPVAAQPSRGASGLGERLSQIHAFVSVKLITLHWCNKGQSGVIECCVNSAVCL